MKFRSIASASLIGFAALVVTSCDTTATGSSTPKAISAPPPVEKAKPSLKAGQATFQHITAKEPDKFTYTSTNTAGFISVTYSDGVVVRYSPDARNNGKIWITVKDDTTPGDFTWDGDTLVIKTERNTTKLGDFKQAFFKAKTFQAKVAREDKARIEAHESKMAEINNESFDEMVSRLSKKACVVLESQSSINKYTVNKSIEQALQNFRMGEAAKNRWNNMNPQLRGENVRNAMIWDCNNAMGLAGQNDINNSLNQLQWQLNNF